MKISPSSSPVEPEKLKPVLHEKIERMDRAQLLLLERILLQIEAEEQAGKLAEAFDQDAARGKFDRISEAIRSFRSARRSCRSSANCRETFCKLTPTSGST